MGRFFAKVVYLTLIIVIPFGVMLRCSTYLHSNCGTSPWLSIILSLLATFVLLLLYGLFVFKLDFIGPDKHISFSKYSKICLLIVFGYGIHGIFFIASSNAKTDDVSKEINDLHPIIRLSLSTLIHLDKSLLITDASRKAEDYESMGLKINSRSLHYKQKDGYVYACDLRTKNHSEVRNFLLKTYFSILGFTTLRHVGTEDHLHIALPLQ